MYKIDESKDREKYILLIPAMLDYHFPLMKYAFYSKNYHPVIIDLEENVENIGLKYVNNDMCYPAIMNVGQIIAALQSGKYDLNRTRVLMATAGDACRGSNYIGTLKRGLKKAGFEDVPVLNINVQGIAKEETMKVDIGMAIRALVSVYYGDILMILYNNVLPNEKNPGTTKAKYDYWMDILATDLKEGRHLSVRWMKRRFKQISDDFATIEQNPDKKQIVGIAGEIYMKYCHLGNWDLEKYLQDNNCQAHTNGVTWYMLYYMDTHLLNKKSVITPFCRIAQHFLAGIQKKMVNEIRRNGFFTLDDFMTLKEKVRPYISMNYSMGDGWLVGMECAGYLLSDCRKVMSLQSFCCMVMQTCGKGMYSVIERRLSGKGHIANADIDTSGSRMNYYNRVHLLIHQN